MASRSSYSQRHNHLSNPYSPPSSATSSRQNNNSNTHALTIPQLLQPSPLPTTATNQAIQPQPSQPTTSTHTTHDIAFSPDKIPFLDEYGQDPKFLELQQELRCLLFTGARSRRGSTSYDDEISSSYRPEEEVDAVQEKTSPQLVKQIITSGKMAGYLKNYMAEVAPWVRLVLALLISKLLPIRSSLPLNIN